MFLLSIFTKTADPCFSYSWQNPVPNKHNNSGRSDHPDSSATEVLHTSEVIHNIVAVFIQERSEQNKGHL